MADAAAAAMRLGLPEERVRDALQVGGLTEDDVDALLARDYIPYQPSDQFLNSAEDIGSFRSGNPDSVAAVFDRRRDVVDSIAAEADTNAVPAPVPVKRYRRTNPFAATPR